VGEENNVDTIPNFSFKQFPISVVPAWGTIQTGYTELDITVNLDLRKWTTYYVPPVAYQNNKLGSVELLNFSPSINVDIRDMSKSGFPIKNIPVVEIHNIYNKEEDQTLLWEGEFAQYKKTVKFYEHGFRAFKVQANMYDPKGYRTDFEGNPRTEPTSQGVWLSGYEFKLYYNQPSTIFRTTGFKRDWQASGWHTRDHFHLNRGEGTSASNYEARGQTFPPYDRPWDHHYPEKYSIPAKPRVTNFIKLTEAGRLPGSAPFYLEQPEYKDGDLNGFKGAAATTPVGGYALQVSITNSFWFPNRFSKEVTANYIYKYESGVSYNEKYSNGYEPSNPNFQVQPGVSKVLNGERFQRAECGYGYWLRPGGWPPVSVNLWGDSIFSRATQPGYGVTAAFEPSSVGVGIDDGNNIVHAKTIYVDIYNFEDKDIALALDDNATFLEGTLDLYRIIDPNDRVPLGPDVLPTYATYEFKSIFFQRGRRTSAKIKTGTHSDSDNGQEEWFSKYNGGSSHASADYNVLLVRITNNGNISND